MKQQRWCLHCRWKRCGRTTNRPITGNGWVYCAHWGPGFPDGWYCPMHAAALEATFYGELKN